MSRRGGPVLRWIHRLVGAVFALAIIGGVGLGVLAWRLNQGPLDLPALAREIERQANSGGGPTRLEIGSAEVAWEGWRGGHLSPLEFRLADVRVVDPSGAVRAVLPSAAVSLSLPWLLRGAVAPRAIELRRPVLRVFRAEDGALALDLGSLGEAAAAAEPPPEEAPAAPGPAAAEAAGADLVTRLLAELMHPPSETASPLAALERVAVRGGLLLVVDRQLDRVWWLQQPDLVLHRRPEGGIRGEGSATLRLGGEWVPIRLTGSAGGPPARIALGLALPAVRPGAIARAVPALAPLGLLDATVEATAQATLDGRTWQPTALHAALRAGAGTIALGEGQQRLAIDGLEAELSGVPEALRLDHAVLRLAAAAPPPQAAATPAAPEPPPPPAAQPPPPPRRGQRQAAAPPPPPRAQQQQQQQGAVAPVAPPARTAAGGAAAAAGPVITAAGAARRGAAGGWQGEATLGLDAVEFADLDAYWPPGLVPGARAWLTRNITAGTARNGHWRIAAAVPAGLDSLTVTAVSGSVEAAGATVHWLRPIPPVEGAAATAEFGLTEIVVHTSGGRQQGTQFEAREGTLRFSGFDTGPGDADLQFRLAGPVQDLWAVLKHPRLRLLDRRRIDIGDPSGSLDGRLSLAFPLLDALPVEDLRVRAQARLTELKVPAVLLGRDLEHGAVDATVDNAGLQLAGTGQLADIPLRLDVRMDFRAGPAAQVIERESVSARAEARDLAALGLDLGEVLEGPVAIEARHEARRNGQARATVRADLRGARLRLDPLNWSKPRGTAGVAEAELALRGGALQAVPAFRLEAADLNLRARVPGFRDGRPERIELLDSYLAASRFAGEVRPPPAARDGAAWQVALRGPVLDLRRVLGDRQPPEPPPPPAPRDAAAAAAGPAIAAEARFDRVLLGERRELRGLAAQARLDARGVLQAAEATARTIEASGGGRVAFSLAPQPGGRRRLSLTAEDAGALLRAVDLISSIQGGTLRVQASYDHPRPGATLSGVADMSDFAVRDAPAFGKLLQALSIYGLVEALRGPGLGFDRLEAPFALTPQVLELEDARAFSASLGLTARGRIDRRRNTVDVEGTIVPMYMVNQILGNIPLLGRLFSPERGGGVFAATFRLRGPLADPQVTVNPLATLTPGFLRGLFRVFDQPPPEPAQPRR